MTSPLKGGIPPFGQDMNGILFVLSQIARWLMSGGSLTYDATFAAAPNIGGYPRGAVLLRADGQGFWLNTRDDNETNSDATDGSALGWVSLNADWDASAGRGAIVNRPNLAKVATSGQYSDLAGVPPAHVNADWNAASGLAQILHRPNLAPVATSGQYSDLSGAPTIPAAQVNADWNAASGPVRILNRPNLAAVATSGTYAGLTGEPVIATPQQFDNSTAAATTEFVQRALGSCSGQVTFSDNATLNASHAGMAIQWAGADGGTLTLAPTATLPLNAIAFLVYNHGAGVLNLLTQGGDFNWIGGPSEVPAAVLRPGEFALCLSRVNGEYDVLATRLPTSFELPAATSTTLGGIIAGRGTAVAADGTLSTTGTAIVNLTAAANVTLDLTPIARGAPEILFNLPTVAGVTTVLSISNPPASGTLAEFTLQVKNGAGSTLTFPATVRWSQGIAPSITGVDGRVDTFVLFTQDEGVSYYGYVAALNQ